MWKEKTAMDAYTLKTFGGILLLYLLVLLAAYRPNPPGLNEINFEDSRTVLPLELPTEAELPTETPTEPPTTPIVMTSEEPTEPPTELMAIATEPPSPPESPPEPPAAPPTAPPTALPTAPPPPAPPAKVPPPGGPHCPPSLSPFVFYIPSSGGMGDKLRGLVVAYYLSLMMNRTLAVSNPIKDPSLIEIPSQFATPFRKTPTSVSHFRFHSIRGRESAFLPDLEPYRKVCVVEILTNRGDLGPMFSHEGFLSSPAKDFVMKLRNQGLLWSTALRNTLLPGPRILKLLQQIDSEHFGGPRVFKVGIHVRSTDLYLLQNKRRDQRIPPSAVPCYSQELIRIWSSMPAAEKQRYPGGLMIFVTADTPSFAKEVQGLLTAAKIPWFDTTKYAGLPVHTRMRADQTRTMLDWWLFTKMDLLIASRSGFSESAARYSCTSVSIHCPRDRTFPEDHGICQRFFHHPAPGFCQPHGMDLKPFDCP